MDFASSLLGWVIYKCIAYLEWVGAGILTVITVAMLLWNRHRINKMNK